ncbi:MAG: OmpA family protein [Deltaproteobacteria bacterium]|nr:OmpA family protein [Deltaproteobacteria bacterium]
MRENHLLAVGIVLLSVSLVFGCAQQSKTAKGAGIGAATGAAAGAIIGSTQGEVGKGAVIGGLLGAGIGAGIGKYLDEQEKELKKVPDATVQRQEDRLVVTMQNSILFDTDSAAINPGSYDTLTQIAGVLKKYPRSEIIVKGYTDATGSERYNQQLSERRADAVENFLIAQGVSGGRITAIGFGESMPVASNETEAGRQANRRVELEIRPYTD